MVVGITINRRLLYIGLALWVLVTSGAASAQQPVKGSVASGNNGRYEWLYEPREQEYVLDVGDVFDLKFFAHPELNDTGVVVRSDGKISAPLIGDIMARGRTPTELKDALAKAYTRGELRQPIISIFLRKSAGLRVFVGGEVNHPGMVTHEGRLTLSRAVIGAGGPKRSAKMRNVVVLRRSEKGDGAEPLFAVVDLKKILAGGRDPLLQPYDSIFVPKTKIAKWGDLIGQAGLEYLFYGALYTR